MRAQVNGVERELPEGTTVAQLLSSAGIAGSGIAVAVNERVVGRSTHETTAVRDGDRIEIIRAVGGG